MRKGRRDEVLSTMTTGRTKRIRYRGEKREEEEVGAICKVEGE